MQEVVITGSWELGCVVDEEMMAIEVVMSVKSRRYRLALRTPSLGSPTNPATSPHGPRTNLYHSLLGLGM